MWSDSEEQMVLAFGDLDLLRQRSALQPCRNLDLEISSLNLPALQGMLRLHLLMCPMFVKHSCSIGSCTTDEAGTAFPLCCCPCAQKGEVDAGFPKS